MRWFRNLTGSTYDGKPIAEALGGAAAASEAGAEAGWLARGYRAVWDFAKRHYKISLGAAAGLAAMAAAEGGADAGTMVDINWRLAGDYSNIHYLDDKTIVTSNDAYYDIPSGDVVDENYNMMPEAKRFRLYFKDNGGQIAGITPINWSTSDYSDGKAIYGDIPTTPSIDEGILLYETPGIIAFDITDNIYFIGQFTSGRLLTEGFRAEGGDIGVNNIKIDTSNPIPEPATLALLGAGAGIAALTRRRRKFQPDMDSGLGKPIKS
jgi:hypothetical protein